MNEIETQQSTDNFAAVGFSLAFVFPLLPPRLVPWWLKCPTKLATFQISFRDSGRKKLVRTLAIYKLTFVALLGSDGVLIHHSTYDHNVLGY